MAMFAFGCIELTVFGVLEKINTYQIEIRKVTHALC